MKQHGNATLTVAKRKQIKLLFENQQLSIAELARRFAVHRDTIRKWIHRESPFDKTAPARQKRVITAEYEQAVINYRRANPQHGAIRLALALQGEFACAGRGTVALILKKHGLTKKGRSRPKTKWKIPVGLHRLQCDVQELPAIKGNTGFEYKISFIHLRTRWKYSEIHPDCTTETVTAVYHRALDSMPPFSSLSPITQCISR